MSKKSKIHHPIVYLEVPYAEKNQAKALGARWDSEVRKWYVPSGMSAANFSRWISVPRVGQAIEDPNSARGIGLSELLGQVSSLIADRFREAVWVRAEIGSLRPTRSGHLRLELVEHDPSGSQIACAEAFLWADRKRVLCDKFEQATGGALAVGLKVLFLLRPRLHANGGFWLVIEDLDPSFTLGDINAKIRAILATLERENLRDRNKNLSSPRDFCQVAVISPQGAAGLLDFQREAEWLERLGLCRFTYHTACFQGPEAKISLLEVLRKLYVQHQQGARFDAVCLIRGGGAVSDLLWLNELELARAICLFPVPVLVGIGHERDKTVLDEVAHKSLGTPSKVVGHIRDTIVHSAQEAEKALQEITALASRRLSEAERQLDLRFSEIQRQAQQQFTLASEQILKAVVGLGKEALSGLSRADRTLESIFQEIRHQAASLLSEAAQRIDRTLDTLCFLAHKQLERAVFEIETLAQEVLNAHPKKVLQRGYVLVRDARGTLMTSAAQARTKELLELEFADGHVQAVPRR